MNYIYKNIHDTKENDSKSFTLSMVCYSLLPEEDAREMHFSSGWYYFRHAANTSHDQSGMDAPWLQMIPFFHTVLIVLWFVCF